MLIQIAQFAQLFQAVYGASNENSADNPEYDYFESRKRVKANVSVLLKALVNVGMTVEDIQKVVEYHTDVSGDNIISFNIYNVIIDKSNLILIFNYLKENNPDIQKISIVNCRLDSVPENLFYTEPSVVSKHFQKLTSLNLSFNKIKEISAGALNDLVNLQYLYLN